jgi:hypothetical protein
MKGVSTAAYSLNEYHLQIRCILEKSGSLALQEHGLNWKLQYRGRWSSRLGHCLIQHGVHVLTRSVVGYLEMVAVDFSSKENTCKLHS